MVHVAGVVVCTVVVPVKLCMVLSLVSVISTLVNALDAAVLGGFLTALTKKSKL